MTVYESMLEAWDEGFCPIPVRADGSKAPAVSWKIYQEQRPDRAIVERWAEKLQGFGIVCGWISGGFEVLEFESRAIELLDPFEDRLRAEGLYDLWVEIFAGYHVQSPSGGIHFGYRVEPAQPNTKLAADPTGVLIETRGAGGFVVAAPSAGKVHPTGKPYVWVGGGWSEVATISREDRDRIWQVARSLDRSESMLVTAGTGERPGDAYNEDPRALDETLELLLAHGWTVDSRQGGTTYLCRPGKKSGKSASLGDATSGGFYLWSTSVGDFEVGKRYSPFQVYAILEHGSDFVAAAKALSERYGSHRTVSPSSTDTGQATQAQGAAESPGEATGEIPFHESPWFPVDMAKILEDGYVDPPPDILYAGDHALLYSGKVNSIQGEPESGKSWVAQYAAAQLLESGGSVLYIDLEAAPHELLTRLQSLGADNQSIVDRFKYVRPDGKPDAWMADLLDLAASVGLVVVDGMTDLFSVYGLNYADNQEVSALFRSLLRPLADQGPAVVTIDHVTKAKETRGRWAIGGQHKLAAVTGASYSVESFMPMGRGQEGSSNIYLEKDRHGHVSYMRMQQGRRLVGEFRINAVRGFDAELRHHAQVKVRMDDILTEKVLNSLERQLPLAPTVNQLVSDVDHNEQATRDHLARMVAEGMVEVFRDGRFERVRALRDLDGEVLPFPQQG